MARIPGITDLESALLRYSDPADITAQSPITPDQVRRDVSALARA